MKPKRTEKKNFFSKSSINISSILDVNTLICSVYNGLFKVYRMDSTQTAIQYIAGLLCCDKGHENMERMTEKVDDSDYKRYIHFLSSSNWNAADVNMATLQEADKLLRIQKKKSGLPTGLIIDETSHLKKGSKSVGVARQYAGVAGKVDNCQVAVHTCLANSKFCTLVGTELFIPQDWIKDKQRCHKAGIPEQEQTLSTKPQLALKLIKQAVCAGTDFDFIAGDGLYGHNSELTRALDGLNLFYVLDVHKDEKIFLSEPTFSIPVRKNGKGRTPVKVQPNIEAIQLQEYLKTLTPKDFTSENVRETAKGWKVAQVHTRTVWHWDQKEEKACERTVVITVSNKTKFSFSNGNQEEYTNKQWAYFQCSRYWVERCFDDCKNELGMSGYQVTGWLAWQHHMALVLMASLYILNVKIKEQDQMPLLSVRDARLLVIAITFASQEQVDLCLEQIQNRHRKRQRDIDRCYEKVNLVK